MSESVNDYLKRQFREHYRLSLSEATIAEWVIDLKGFKYIEIVRAFDKYRASDKKYSPKSNEIRYLILDGKREEKKETKNNCYVVSCKNSANERRDENIWMCRKHSDDWILKTQPESIEAKIILGARKIEAEAKVAGMTNREYFEKSNPSSFDVLQKMMTRKNEGRHNIFAVEEYLSGR